MVEKIISHDEYADDPSYGETVIAENVSFPDYLKLCDGQHAEWLTGTVMLQASKTVQHQSILGFLALTLNLFLGSTSRGRLMLMGFTMFISPNHAAREPDLLIVLNENRQRIKENYLNGPADLVVEIVSVDSMVRDRGEKFIEYEAARIPEYWLIDPLRTEANVYALGADGHYHPRPRDAEGRLTSQILPGFALHPDLLWREQPPTGAELVELVQQMTR